MTPDEYREAIEWLGLSQIVDFRGNYDDGCRDLLQIWGIGLKV